MISPRVASRLARIRSGCTTRPSSTSAMSTAAPPAAASAPAMPSHSACQAPAARSCSCTRLPVRSVAERLRPACTGERERRSDRVALVRERGGSAAALAGGLAQLADLGLGHEHDVERDLAERARQRREGRSQGGDAHARGVPGQRGLLQGELARHAAHDLGAVLAQGGQRAGRAAQLHGQPVARVDTQPPGLEHADEPRRGLAGRTSSAAPAGAACARPWASRGGCRPARRRPPSPRATSASTSSSARRLTSIAAVSTMSWLVAP